MNPTDRESHIREIVDLLLERPATTGLMFSLSQLDTSRPNQHDSKAEFLIELKIVERALVGAKNALSAMLGSDTAEDSKANDIIGRLQKDIDIRAKQRMNSLRLADTSELIRKNLADTGFFLGSLWVLADLSIVLDQRHKELQDQERQFWTVGHRPANYYARAIALRLARLYANQKGKAPTFGTARDGGHPSTDFGRALEKIFSLLEIKGATKNAATWAIGELTADDMKVPMSGLLGLAFSKPAENLASRINALSNHDAILAALQKSPET